MKAWCFERGSDRKLESEDALIRNEKYAVYGVLDGSTPLVPYLDEFGHNGAYLAAHVLKEYFEADYDISLSLKDNVEHANSRLRDVMLRKEVHLDNPAELWSTCIAVVAIEQNQLHFAQLGDSMILVRKRNGDINVLTENTITGLDQRAKAKRTRDRQNNVTVEAESHFSSLKERLFYNRTLANDPIGYSVANGMPAVNDRIQSGTIPLDDIGQVLVISDGLFHPDYSLEETFRLILNQGFDEYANLVLDSYRVKSRSEDDMAGIRLELKANV